jgi:hypothetical protein
LRDVFDLDRVTHDPRPGLEGRRLLRRHRVTDGTLLAGVRTVGGRIVTSSLSLRSRSGAVRFMQNPLPAPAT